MVLQVIWVPIGAKRDMQVPEVPHLVRHDNVDFPLFSFSLAATQGVPRVRGLARKDGLWNDDLGPSNLLVRCERTLRNRFTSLGTAQQRSSLQYQCPRVPSACKSYGCAKGNRCPGC